ncbi:MAG: peptidoglycan DD-metalloendopeptidase family protein [Firmicutes bacterium]|jgi:murein DD-endopeptidase MepM/ murein hydrolase activator NlpD|nr:peptidoglycan DD-metalloendopeptidase family protein [Bacillota bacterium]
MRFPNIRQWPAVLGKKLRRAYHYSELRKLLLWLKGKTLHWALYLALASFLAGASLGLHFYLSQFFYVNSVEGREVGMVRDAGEIEQFLTELNERCSSLYGMSVEPEQEILLNREYRFDGEADAPAVKEALRQQITLKTEAVMLTVNWIPAIPLKSEEEIPAVINLLTNAYTRQESNVRLLEVKLVEEIAGMPCSVPPEAVCSAEEAAEFLLCGANPENSRLLLASRHGEALREKVLPETDEALPAIHVQTVEEVKTVEAIPYDTSYTYNDKMWYAQSHVLIPGKAGKKEVTYHVTRENGEEISREIVSQKVLQEPVTQVIEKGTSRAPAIGSGRFLWPVTGGFVTSGYRTASRPGHTGVDIYHPKGRGTPILAADSGVVVEAGLKYPQGNYIVIYHGSYYTVYAHNSVNYVSTGAKVARGQTIALMGNTGRTFGRTGVHLHFEIRRCDGSGVWGYWSKNPAVNPLGFFKP